MKRGYITLGVILALSVLAIGTSVVGYIYRPTQEFSAVPRVFTPRQGGTGTSTLPSYGEYLQGNTNGGYDLVSTTTLNIPNQTLQDAWIRSESTAWISTDGATTTVTRKSDTTVDIATTTCQFVDNFTDPDNPSYTKKIFPAVTDVTVTQISDQPLTEFGYDVNGNIIQATPVFSTENNRDYCSYGIVNHFDRVKINEGASAVTGHTQVSTAGLAQQLRDLSSALGTSINKSGNFISGTNGALTIDITAGTTFAQTVNKLNAKDPNFFNTAASTITEYLYSFRDGSGGFLSTTTATLVPGIFDDNSPSATDANGVVPANRYGIHKIRYVPGPNGPFTVVSYPQTTYSSFAEACQAIFNEIATDPLAFQFVKARAYGVLRGDATDLSDESQARFFNTDALGVSLVKSCITDGIANTHNILNGMIASPITASTTSNGTTVTFTVDNLDVAGSGIDVQFDGMNYLVSTPTSTTLTVGTDEVPSVNYVYFTRDVNDNAILNVNTSGYPTSEHAKVTRVIVPSAVTVQAEGVYSENIDSIRFGNGQGILEESIAWIKAQHASYFSGISQTLTITTNAGVPDDVDLALSSGVLRELKLVNFNAFDSSTGDLFYVVNDSTSAYATTTDLNTVLTDSDGDSMSGKYFNLVVWAVAGEEDRDGKVFINLPSCSYIIQSEAVDDVDGCTDQTIPASFKGKGILVSRYTLQHSVASGGTWTEIQHVNLRGTEPSTSGGAGGATGVLGNGVLGRVAFWSDVDTISSDSLFNWSTTTSRLAAGLATATTTLHAYHATDDILATFESGNTGAFAAFMNTTGTGFVGQFGGKTQIGQTGTLSTNNFTIDTTGQVGIQKTTPIGKFDLGCTTSPIFSGNTTAFICDNRAGIAGLELRNINTGSTAEFRFAVVDTSGHYLAFSSPSVNNTNTLLGQTRRTSDFIFNNAGTTRNLTIGTFNTTDLIFGTDNAERVRILSSGEFGIGTTSPWALLSVNPNGITGPSFAVGSSSATDFVVTNGGNVGIGLTSPDEPLDIVDPTDGGASAANIIKLRRRGGTGTFGAIGTIHDGSDGVVGLTFSASSAIRAFLDAQGDFGVGVSGTNASARIHALATSEQFRLAYDSSNYWADTTSSDGGRSIVGAGSDADINFDLSGATDGDFSINSNDVFVDTSTGNVGIGSITPRSALDINTTDALLTIQPLNATSSEIRMRHGSIGVSSKFISDVSSNLQIWTSDTEKMRITATGLVGIGTTTPASLAGVARNLTIAGTSAGIRFDDTDATDFELYTAGGRLKVWNEATASDSFTIDSSGNVGIGTTTPQRIISASSGAAATTTVQIGDVYSGTGKTCFEAAQIDGSIISWYFVSGAPVYEPNACN